MIIVVVQCLLQCLVQSGNSLRSRNPLCLQYVTRRLLSMRHGAWGGLGEACRRCRRREHLQAVYEAVYPLPARPFSSKLSMAPRSLPAGNLEGPWPKYSPRRDGILTGSTSMAIVSGFRLLGGAGHLILTRCCWHGRRSPARITNRLLSQRRARRRSIRRWCCGRELLQVGSVRGGYRLIILRNASSRSRT